jgi:DNA-binding response OmpR family regulator
VAITGHHENTKFVDEIMACGADDCFTKPIEFPAFLKQVKKLLAESEAEQTARMTK